MAAVIKTPIKDEVVEIVGRFAKQYADDVVSNINSLIKQQPIKNGSVTK